MYYVGSVKIYTQKFIWLSVLNHALANIKFQQHHQPVTDGNKSGYVMKNWGLIGFEIAPLHWFKDKLQTFLDQFQNRS